MVTNKISRLKFTAWKLSMDWAMSAFSFLECPAAC